jgi:hypothetical protein
VNVLCVRQVSGAAQRERPEGLVASRALVSRDIPIAGLGAAVGRSVAGYRLANIAGTCPDRSQDSSCEQDIVLL